MGMDSRLYLLCLAFVFIVSSAKSEEFLSGIDLEIQDTGAVLSQEELAEEITHLNSMPQSHTTALFKTVKRRRRTAEDSLISLRFRIFNVTHVFRMTHNTGVLSPEYSIEEMGSDGVPHPVQSTLEDCYFAQEMRDEEMATVTVCGDDIEGIIATNDHMYVFQPRKKNKEQVIVWELDNTTLPQGKVEGTGSNACRRPERPVNGHVKLSGIAVGSVVEYSCKDGYTMVGSPTARCLVSREWSDDTPACVLLTQHGGMRTKCPLLKSPENGGISVTTGHVWTALYSCDDGFRLRGNRHRYCQDNGKWSGHDPYCSSAPTANIRKEWVNGSIGPEEVIGRDKRGVLNLLGEHEVIELLLYYDIHLYNRFSRNRALLERHMTTVINLYACIMQDLTIGKPVYVKIVRIVIETTSSRLTTSREASTLSNSFCAVQRTLQQPVGAPQNFDYAILITGRIMCSFQQGRGCVDGTIGYAPLGGMCTEFSCAVVEHYGLQTGFTVAHETGHGLDMVHDYYGNSCPDRGNVMAARLGRGKILYKWSRCSKEELMTFRLSGGTHCLQEDTPGAISLPPLPSTIAAHTIDYQCKKSRGEQATRCPFAIRGAPSVCSWFYCKIDNTNLCWTDYFPAIDGTECGTNRICVKGDCVLKVSRPPVHGNWSSWGPWSSCSRSCGCGVQTRRRECNNPPPARGGRYCPGHCMQARLCNKQDCPTNHNYRAQQCASYDKPHNGRKYNKWTLYERAPVNKCSRVCVPEGQNFYAVLGSFRDGTPCPPSKGYAKAVCVQGACVDVGCDGMLRGGTLDACRVCNGGNCSCRHNTSMITLRDLTHGYRSGFTLKKEWTTVKVMEQPAEYNTYMAVKYKGRYLFNGFFRLSYFGTYHAGSVPIMYWRNYTTRQDFLMYDGPLDADLTVELLVDGRVPVCIFKISYYEPNKPGSTSCPETTSLSSSTVTPTTTTLATSMSIPAPTTTRQTSSNNRPVKSTTQPTTTITHPTTSTQPTRPTTRPTTTITHPTRPIQSTRPTTRPTTTITHPTRPIRSTRPTTQPTTTITHPTRPTTQPTTTTTSKSTPTTPPPTPTNPPTTKPTTTNTPPPCQADCKDKLPGCTTNKQKMPPSAWKNVCGGVVGLYCCYSCNC